MSLERDNRHLARHLLLLQGMKKLLLSFVMAFCALPHISFGWGHKGHQLVAEVAWEMLNEKAKANLKQHLDGFTIESAATWMDDIKSNRSYSYMNKWHYVNVPKGGSYTENGEENVISELEKTISALRKNEHLSADDYAKELRILFHLVGDLHQPLHCGYGDDKGGNDIQVNYNKHNSNLHRVWDTDIIESEHISLADCLAMKKTFTEGDLAHLTKIDVKMWMRQPRSQLKQVYDFPEDGTIDMGYISKNKDLVKEDIFIAGARLAAVINDILGK